MNTTKRGRLLFFVTVLALAAQIALAAEPPQQERLSVGVTEPDIEAIVTAVGGNEVDTFSLFRGCILRGDLTVEPTVKNRLKNARAVVWTGFLNESAAITAELGSAKPSSKAQAGGPQWIDVSRGAARVNVPASTCLGYVDPNTMSGDPFFWLNPKNGSIIARNVAEGLGVLRPQKRAFFLANADVFSSTLGKDIDRWKQALKPLAKLRVFSTQCGWQNFSKLGGPVLVVCKGSPGSLPTPHDLLDRVKQMRAQVILVDPNTPADYGNAFREQSGLRVIEVSSSIENIPGAHSYSALFDNFVEALQAAAKEN